jgi:YkoY family integral membrane protein
MMSNILATGFALLSVAVVDSLLSVDNALVLAVMVEHLPGAQQTKALRYGILGAYAMRGVSIFAASLLIGFWPLKLFGGMYLLGLAISHLFAKAKESATAKASRHKRGFWVTVVLVEWLDFTFSLDNILATVALSREIWIVIAGVCISILAMRFLAGVCLRWLNSFPILRTTAYVLLLFIGAKLLAGLAGFYLGEIQTFAVLLTIISGSMLYEQLKRRSAKPRNFGIRIQSGLLQGQKHQNYSERKR